MNKKRWPLLNNPFGIELPKPKPIIHPVINKWEDFTEEDKTILQNIKKIITLYIGDCRMGVYGSRIKGNWNEKSDYDIGVFTYPDESIQEKLRKYNYGVRVDLVFLGEPENLILKVEI